MIQPFILSNREKNSNEFWDVIRHFETHVSSELRFSAGTSVLLEVSKELGVRRFLYCSSSSAVTGCKDIVNGTEENTAIPETLLATDYGKTKLRAEIMVLDNNCKCSKTIFFIQPAYGFKHVGAAKTLRYQFVCLLFLSDTLHNNKRTTIESRHDKTYLREFPTRPDTNRHAQPQKLARVLKFRP